MRSEHTTAVSTGKPCWWRIRHYGIKPDRFSWTADISKDGGKS